MNRFLLLFGVLLLACLSTSSAVAGSAAISEEASETVDEPASRPGRQIIAYYFHGNYRCKTCRTIEAYAKEAIEGGFAAELTDGRLAWRVVNIDEPEHEHFVKDFGLTTRSLVLVEYRDGQAGQWQNLNDVWTLVRDKNRFLAYVRGETRKLLGSA